MTNTEAREPHVSIPADELERLRAERDQYKTLFNEALDYADSVFHLDSTKPPPLLPDFLPLGSSKFAGVVKLAKEYIAAQKRIERLQQLLRMFVSEEKCQLDHNGNCQEHGWFGGPCPVPEARQLLTESDG